MLKYSKLYNNSQCISLNLPTGPTAVPYLELFPEFELPLLTVSVASQKAQMSRTPNMQKHVRALEAGFQKTIGFERSTAVLCYLINVGNGKNT